MQQNEKLNAVSDATQGQNGAMHSTTGNESADNRQRYVKPELICYGDVRDVTLGPTVGFGESGGGPFCALGVSCP